MDSLDVPLEPSQSLPTNMAGRETDDAQIPSHDPQPIDRTGATQISFASDQHPPSETMITVDPHASPSSAPGTSPSVSNTNSQNAAHGAVTTQDPLRQTSTWSFTNLSVGCIALLLALVFGIGAWVGQNYANKYAKESYELSLWGLCADHEVGIMSLIQICGLHWSQILTVNMQSIKHLDICRDQLKEGPKRITTRNLNITKYRRGGPNSSISVGIMNEKSTHIDNLERNHDLITSVPLATCTTEFPEPFTPEGGIYPWLLSIRTWLYLIVLKVAIRTPLIFLVGCLRGILYHMLLEYQGSSLESHMLIHMAKWLTGSPTGHIGMDDMEYSDKKLLRHNEYLVVNLIGLALSLRNSKGFVFWATGTLL